MFPDRQHVGALVVGGDHPGLGVARSLGRHGIPVVVIEDQLSVSECSRYVKQVVRVKDILNENAAAESIMEVGKQLGLEGWVLIPTRDETVAAIARHRARLEKFFRLTTQEWETIQWAWDKNKTYLFAEKLAIPVPSTWTVQKMEDLRELYPRLPLAIKPSIKENFFYATGAKAWRADTPEQLCEIFNRAIEHIPADEAMIQEIVPGDGSTQYSYCAFVVDGEPQSTLIARRGRQHPREFGRAATYVETTERPEVEELSRRFLKALKYHGLVEIEFKFDARDQQYKLLDVNARAWGFHSLGMAAGVDFCYMLFADKFGERLTPVRARPGVGWVRVVTDIPTAWSQIAAGYIPFKEYLTSLRNSRSEAIFAADDIMPSIAELVFLPYLVVKKLLPKKKNEEVMNGQTKQRQLYKNDVG